MADTNILLVCNLMMQKKHHVFFNQKLKNLVKYKEIWTEIKNIMEKKKFDKSTVFGDIGNKYLRTKVKSYNNKIILQ